MYHALYFPTFIFTLYFPCLTFFSVDHNRQQVLVIKWVIFFFWSPKIFFYFFQFFKNGQIQNVISTLTNVEKLDAVHSTSWKCSTWWKFSLYYVYIFIADWNFLTKFCRSDPSFNRNILTPLYLKSETSAHAQLCDYSFIHTIYKFHGMVLAGNSHWGYLLINGVYR